MNSSGPGVVNPLSSVGFSKKVFYVFLYIFKKCLRHVLIFFCVTGIYQVHPGDVREPASLQQLRGFGHFRCGKCQGPIAPAATATASASATPASATAATTTDDSAAAARRPASSASNISATDSLDTTADPTPDPTTDDPDVIFADLAYSDDDSPTLPVTPSQLTHHPSRPPTPAPSRQANALRQTPHPGSSIAPAQSTNLPAPPKPAPSRHANALRQTPHPGSSIAPAQSTNLPAPPKPAPSRQANALRQTPHPGVSVIPAQSTNNETTSNVFGRVVRVYVVPTGQAKRARY